MAAVAMLPGVRADDAESVTATSISQETLVKAVSRGLPTMSKDGGECLNIIVVDTHSLQERRLEVVSNSVVVRTIGKYSQSGPVVLAIPGGDNRLMKLTRFSDTDLVQLKDKSQVKLLCTSVVGGPQPLQDLIRILERVFDLKCDVLPSALTDLRLPLSTVQMLWNRLRKRSADESTAMSPPEAPVHLFGPTGQASSWMPPVDRSVSWTGGGGDDTATAQRPDALDSLTDELRLIVEQRQPPHCLLRALGAIESTLHGMVDGGMRVTSATPKLTNLAATASTVAQLVAVLPILTAPGDANGELHPAIGMLNAVASVVTHAAVHLVATGALDAVKRDVTTAVVLGVARIAALSHYWSQRSTGVDERGGAQCLEDLDVSVALISACSLLQGASTAPEAIVAEIEQVDAQLHTSGRPPTNGSATPALVAARGQSNAERCVAVAESALFLTRSSAAAVAAAVAGVVPLHDDDFLCTADDMADGLACSPGGAPPTPVGDPHAAPTPCRTKTGGTRERRLAQRCLTFANDVRSRRAACSEKATGENAWLTTDGLAALGAVWLGSLTALEVSHFAINECVIELTPLGEAMSNKGTSAAAAAAATTDQPVSGASSRPNRPDAAEDEIERARLAVVELRRLRATLIALVTATASLQVALLSVLFWLPSIEEQTVHVHRRPASGEHLATSAEMSWSLFHRGYATFATFCRRVPAIAGLLAIETAQSNATAADFYGAMGGRLVAAAAADVLESNQSALQAAQSSRAWQTFNAAAFALLIAEANVTRHCTPGERPDADPQKRSRSRTRHESSFSDASAAALATSIRRQQQHSWLIRLTVGCGIQGPRALLATLHVFYRSVLAARRLNDAMALMLTTEDGDMPFRRSSCGVGQMIALPLAEVQSVLASLKAVSPSPSSLAGVWDAVLRAAASLSAIATLPTAASVDERLTLAGLLLKSGVTRDAILRSAGRPSASLWSSRSAHAHRLLAAVGGGDECELPPLADDALNPTDGWLSYADYFGRRVPTIDRSRKGHGADGRAQPYDTKPSTLVLPAERSPTGTGPPPPATSGDGAASDRRRLFLFTADETAAVGGAFTYVADLLESGSATDASPLPTSLGVACIRAGESLQAAGAPVSVATAVLLAGYQMVARRGRQTSSSGGNPHAFDELSMNVTSPSRPGDAKSRVNGGGQPQRSEPDAIVSLSRQYTTMLWCFCHAPSAFKAATSWQKSQSQSLFRAGGGRDPERDQGGGGQTAGTGGDLVTVFGISEDPDALIGRLPPGSGTTTFGAGNPSALHAILSAY